MTSLRILNSEFSSRSSLDVQHLLLHHILDVDDDDDEVEDEDKNDNDDND